MVATAINITGASFLWPLNAIIMTQLLGQSLTASGAVLMLNAGAGVLGSLIGGRLYDRIGAYPTFCSVVFFLQPLLFCSLSIMENMDGTLFF